MLGILGEARRGEVLRTRLGKSTRSRKSMPGVAKVVKQCTVPIVFRGVGYEQNIVT